jgi:hypothetical protein
MLYKKHRQISIMKGKVECLLLLFIIAQGYLSFKLSTRQGTGCSESRATSCVMKAAYAYVLLYHHYYLPLHGIPSLQQSKIQQQHSNLQQLSCKQENTPPGFDFPLFHCDWLL